METVAMGFIFGYILSVVFIGIGYALGLNIGQKADKEVEESKPEETKYKHTYDDMSQVLQVLRLGASRYEREILNEIIDVLSEREEKANDN